MTLPAFLFALMIASLYGALYHFFRGGGGFGRLMLYLGLSALGFAIGHLIGWWRGWVFASLGSLNMGMSTLGSFLILVFGDWLSRIETARESKV
jgi:hypothetical protein